MNSRIRASCLICIKPVKTDVNKCVKIHAEYVPLLGITKGFKGKSGMITFTILVF